MMGHRSIYHDGWRAVCPWPGPSFTEAGKGFGAPIPADMLTELDAKHWELYHVAEDFAENHNLAADNRPKLIEMIASWYVEAGKYNVLPVDGRGTLRMIDQRPEIAVDRSSYTYYPNSEPVPTNAAVKVLNRSHTITADVEIPKGGAEGVLIMHGGSDGGYSFYVKDGNLHYVHNYVSKTRYAVTSTASRYRGPDTNSSTSSRLQASLTLRTGKGTPVADNYSSTESRSDRPKYRLRVLSPSG